MVSWRDVGNGEVLVKMLEEVIGMEDGKVDVEGGKVDVEGGRWRFGVLRGFMREWGG